MLVLAYMSLMVFSILGKSTALTGFRYIRGKQIDFTGWFAPVYY